MKKSGFRALNKIVVAFVLSFGVVGYGQSDSPRLSGSSETSPDSPFFEETSSEEDSIPHFLETEDDSGNTGDAVDSTDNYFSAAVNFAAFSPAFVDVTINGQLRSGYKISFEKDTDNQYKMVVILTYRHVRGGHRGREVTSRLRFKPVGGQFSRQGDTMYFNQTPVATHGWWSGWTLTSNAQLGATVERRPGSFYLYRVTPRLNF